MAQQTRTPRSNNISPGVHIGKVVSHLDGSFMGGIEVMIVKRTEAGSIENYVTCKYASPFAGQSPYDGVTDNDGHEYSQKSYGFWAVPPDPGTMVIVLMPDGDYSQAYWVACIPDLGMNFMTPGNPSTTANSEDSSVALPVTEYNKRQEEGAGQDYTKFVKPTNTVEKERLENAGLDKDSTRGYNSSSARREAPSAVFGWSTPGPPDLDGPKYTYGRYGASIQRPFNRLGGSSFVMDDGDMSLRRRKAPGGDESDKPSYANINKGESDGDKTIPANELVRLQTRHGHQILLHNSEDLIYISHGSGNSWIEMTANGKIDVYAKDSISFRSENDINFYADRDINFESGGNTNFTSTGGSTFISSTNNVEIKAGKDGKITAGNTTNISAKTHHETALGGIYMNSDESASDAVDASVPVRIPAHEPWSDHENNNPKEFVADKTVAASLEERKEFVNGTLDEAPEQFVLADTFKRST